MKHIIIGTAGHVDHGKTWLTRALTGTNTDRWKEEQERGITLDIGFAQLTLPNGQSASIIDVPGHEALVRNMIAGATGIDVVLLVVAADEGFMPQTQEHLDILTLLGIERGIVVMTKCDAVEDEWADMVEADIQDRVKGTFLEGAPVIRVSAMTGEGIPELKDAIVELVADARPKNAERFCRLPVDRSFTVKGFGTVITGTLVDGTMHIGDELEVYPKRLKTRIRDLQNHDVSAPQMEAGMRVAANLQGIERKAVTRGCIVAEPDTMLMADRLLAHVEIMGDAAFSVKNSSQVHFYTGTEELVARVRLLDTDELLPGDEGFVQFAFDRQIVARNHDRFVIRFFSPMVTVGGGTILDIAPGRVRRNSEPVLARLRALAGTPEERLGQRLRDAGLRLVPAHRLRLLENLSDSELEDAIAKLSAAGLAVTIGGSYISSPACDDLLAKAHALLQDYHASHALERGMNLGAFRKTLFQKDPEDASMLVMWMADQDAIQVEAGYVSLPGFEAHLTDAQRALLDKVRSVTDAAGFEPLAEEELRKQVGAAPDFDAVIARMHADGDLVTLTPEISASGRIWRQGLETFMRMAEETGSVTIAQFRDAIGVSRKNAGLFLDSFDRAGYTRLVGDARIVLKRPCRLPSAE